MKREKHASKGVARIVSVCYSGVSICRTLEVKVISTIGHFGKSEIKRQCSALGRKAILRSKYSKLQAGVLGIGVLV